MTIFVEPSLASSTKSFISICIFGKGPSPPRKKETTRFAKEPKKILCALCVLHGKKNNVQLTALCR